MPTRLYVATVEVKVLVRAENALDARYEAPAAALEELDTGCEPSVRVRDVEGVNCIPPDWLDQVPYGDPSVGEREEETVAEILGRTERQDRELVDREALRLIGAGVRP